MSKSARLQATHLDVDVEAGDSAWVRLPSAHTGSADRDSSGTIDVNPKRNNISSNLSK
jgi:hypothetical protein